MLRVAPIVAAAALAAMTLAARTGLAADEAVPDTARQRALITLLRHDCGSCHGLRLTGGLGPALTPDALRERPAAGLVATIVYGRPGTAMPPWRPFVSEAEAAWLVARLREGVVDAR
jgi:cytochrome c55X